MCLFPNKAEPQESGRPKFDREGSIQLPCGKCTECLNLRAIDWATRAKHEIALHNENSFITLTYNDENLPSHLVVKDPFQKFMKRLRKHTKLNIRYMVSHEYGSLYFRPHHHAIIFGWNPKEQYEPRKTKSGETIFRSHELENLWTEGFSSVGTANERTAYYIASYALKGKKHNICLPNGEITSVSDCFDSSKRPAIGLNFLIKNQEQIINSKNPIPRYYIKKLKELNPTLHEQYDSEQALLNRVNRSSHEMLAKYTLDQYKLHSSSNEFRAPETRLGEKHYETDLKTKRNDYHSHIKGK